MAFRDLIPWRRQENRLPVPVSAEGGRDSDTHPMLSLHREVDRQFDGLFRAFGVPALAGLYRAAGWPHVELGETDKEIRATAKLPGLDEKDVDITVEDGALTLRGVRRSKLKTRTLVIPSAAIAALNAVSGCPRTSTVTTLTQLSRTAA
ncbi:Hsp20/alpha crystallin family protein [Sphingobium sp. DN12]|uniref:Hsp20/alpha crystallin family protein n=1 Tax=Sphingobium sp. DN12 TaxID=3378073 RepID=UPI003DA5CFE6